MANLSLLGLWLHWTASVEHRQYCRLIIGLYWAALKQTLNWCDFIFFCCHFIDFWGHVLNWCQLIHFWCHLINFWGHVLNWCHFINFWGHVLNWCQLINIWGHVLLITCYQLTSKYFPIPEKGKLELLWAGVPCLCFGKSLPHVIKWHAHTLIWCKFCKPSYFFPVWLKLFRKSNCFSFTDQRYDEGVFKQ